MNNTFDKKRIFYVEDCEGTANLIKSFLEDAGGFIVDIEVNPLVAVERIIEFQPDLIYLDLIMPFMNGLELLEILRRIKEFDTVPIAIITAHTDEKMVVLHKFHADGFIAKPICQKKLIEETHKILRKGIANPAYWKNKHKEMLNRSTIDNYKQYYKI